jgi:hypothetical protein
MKKLLTILCLVLLSSYSYSQETLQETIQTIVSETLNVSEGDLIEREGIFYKKFTVTPFTGNTVSFFKNGQLKQRVTYKGGIRNGLMESFDENGQLQLRGNYKDGKLDGSYETFHDNGQLEQRGIYKNGKMDGLREYFDKDGNLTETEVWKDGELIE